MRLRLEIMRKISKPAAIFFALHMLMLSGLCQSITAAMIGTESILKADQSQNSREYLNNLLARKEIQAALISQGLDPQEARDRIDNLTNDEIGHIVHELDQIPAGGGFFEAFIAIVFLVFLILLVTDISGYTDVFPFVIKHAPQKTAKDETIHDTAIINKTKPSVEDYGINPADILIIYFKPDSNDLTAKAIQSLDRVVEFMAENAKTTIDIIGFSDSTVSPSYNTMLSEVRANTVKNYLLAKGIDSKKITSMGMGSKGFFATSGTEEQRQMIGGVAIKFK
jgi:outer membrane protein OmpA-like peptidoglycan-associated protein